MAKQHTVSGYQLSINRLARVAMLAIEVIAKASSNINLGTSAMTLRVRKTTWNYFIVFPGARETDSFGGTRVVHHFGLAYAAASWPWEVEVL